MAKILISGGTGLIGKRLQQILTLKGYEIHVLSRSKKGKIDGIQYWNWDINNQAIDEEAVQVDHIIHLAGAGVMDEKWTNDRKKILIDSRVKSAQLLYDSVKKQNIQLKSFVSASAVGYYGDQKNKVLTEESPKGNDFLSEVCQKWEATALQMQKEQSFPVSIVRIGIVLSSKGGALAELDKPVKFGIGAYLGDGSQYYPWIHIDDLCQIFVKALLEPLHGTYNAVAPNPVTNKSLVKAIAKAKGRPFIPAPGPKFMIRLVLGDRADVLLTSQNVSSEKIEKSGFEFQFPEIEMALKDIYKRQV